MASLCLVCSRCIPRPLGWYASGTMPVGRLVFGDFAIEAASGELSRGGIKVPLQDQPARALLLLLERSGDLVTREELIGQLWPGDTFVDFERGLNKVVAKLRAALNDDADLPRYVETVPQHGYRFIAAVENLPLPERRTAAPAQSSPRIESLAVLPLVNLSGDPSEEYFSDGITGELISALAAMASLRVVSQTSAMAFKNVRKPLPAIARELRVDAIVEGSVARSSDKVRIMVQLIHASEDRHLWSGRYERDMKDVLQLQAEVAGSIASQIHQALRVPLQASLHQPKVLPAAYEAYLKGNFFRQKLNPADLQRSIGFFNESIDLDPSFAPAHASLARSYQFVGIFGLRHPSEVFGQVRSNAVKALELDPALPLAHITLASATAFERWDWAAAEAQCRLAVQMNPGESFSHAALADYLSIRGQHGEAVAEMRHALDLDPLSVEFHNWLALLHYRARCYRDSIAACERTLEIDPHHVNCLWFSAWALEQSGQVPLAIERLETAVRVSGGPHYRAQLGRLYGMVGETAKARVVLEELREFSKRAYLSPVDLAMVHLGLGDLQSMFDSLEDAYRQRAWRMVELTLPIFDTVRGDARWGSLVRRIGLAQAVGGTSKATSAAGVNLISAKSQK